MSVILKNGNGTPFNVASQTNGSDSAFQQAIIPAKSNGMDKYTNLDLGITGQVVKASAGVLHKLILCCNAAAGQKRWVKVYDKATAPTSSDTPVATILVMGERTECVDLAPGASFSAGISLRASTGVAANDNTAPSTNDVVVDVFYL